MKKVLFVVISLSMLLFAKVDFSEMSTEELLAMMGYVAPKNQKALQQELKYRFPQMSPKEKQIYKANLEKQKK